MFFIPPRLITIIPYQIGQLWDIYGMDLESAMSTKKSWGYFSPNRPLPEQQFSPPRNEEWCRPHPHGGGKKKGRMAKEKEMKAETETSVQPKREPNLLM